MASYAKIMLYFLLLMIYLTTNQLVCELLTGRVDHSVNEMDRLNGRMTPREAAIKCELDDECAGFTYHGPKSLPDDHKFQITFYFYIPVIRQTNGYFMDWTTYLSDDPMKIYREKIPNGPINRFYEINKGDFIPGKKAKEYCSDTLGNNCTAIAFSNDGTMRIYTHLDLTSFVHDPSWTTYFNSRAPKSRVNDRNTFENVNKCCPRTRYRYIDPVERNSHIQQSGQSKIDRISCNMPEKDFIEKYVRTRTPVVLHGCDFNWLQKSDFSLSNVAKMFFDNSTGFQYSNNRNNLPPTFTHTFTPNDFRITDSQAMQDLDEGIFRYFQRVRNNEICEARGSSCKSTMDLFEKNLRKPKPIPKDLYQDVSYTNNLNWLIMSSEGTGSHPHNDPDLMGAWAYLINGYKLWVIFPQDGVDMEDVMCDHSCSPYAKEDPLGTWRWMQHVLPQLRNKQMYGQKPLELVQGPGEVLFLPQGLTHSILNLHDNVAYTENYLYVGALPDLTKAVVLDDISKFRPKWNQTRALDYFYYSGIANAKDRELMRETYNQVTEQIRKYPSEKKRLEEERNYRWLIWQNRTKEEHSNAK